MANGILDHAVNSGQHKPKSFSLSFDRDMWQNFWRLLTLGCVMSDYILDYDVSDLRHIAKMWRRLSDELSKSVRDHADDDGVPDAKQP